MNNFIPSTGYVRSVQSMGGLMASELTFASLTQAAEAIRDGKITSLELTEHIIQRIERHNPALNAIVTFTKTEAIAQAKAADEALARGDVLGPLHGVPITIKDCFEVAGVRTTAGAKRLSDHVPEEDAATVSRLRKAGAVILGKTNVPIYAGDWQSYNEIFGTTNNPWDLDATPGGSTGGGAAAVASGLSYLSLGSDIGGSIRIPSTFCGLYGHKPTLNILPYRGHIPRRHAPLLTVAGPIARSPEDLKLALTVMGGPDSEEAIAYSWALSPSRRESLSEYRIGYVLDHPSCPLSGEVSAAVQGAVEKLEGNVSALDEGWPPGVDPVKQYPTRPSSPWPGRPPTSSAREPSRRGWRPGKRGRDTLRPTTPSSSPPHSPRLSPTITAPPSGTERSRHPRGPGTTRTSTSGSPSPHSPVSPPP
jgi:amidase